ncbi:MAG: polysaccharide biosynthesis tyrosine autokinase [Chloroflexi bacterium]|nr:MAG: polysaccharide biosynthesis tyrosine autokinase [Chloroflexota bacterium]
MDTKNISERGTLETFELKQLLDVIRRRSWILLLGVVIGAGAAALYSYFQQPVYEATTKVLVTRSVQNPVNDIAGAMTLQQTADTYVQFLSMEPVLNMVSQRVGYVIDPEAQMIDVQLVPNTQIINVAVDDTDPKRAVLIADTLVQVLIEQNEVLQAGRYAENETSLNAQISEMEKQIDGLQDQLDQTKAAALQAQITKVQTQIDDLQEEISVLEDDDLDESAGKTARLEQLQSLMSSYQDTYTRLVVTGEIQGTNDQIDRLEKSLQLYQQLYLNLLGNLETVRMARMQNTPNVVQISAAIVGENPIRPRPVLNTALGGVAGLILALSLMFLIEYLDDTIKTPEDVERLLGLAVLGYVAEVSGAESRQGHLNVSKQPRSPVAEAFRSLRANLEFASINHNLNSILVTSVGPGEGKSTVAANLAAIISQVGRRVTLLDADLRRPTIHRLFDLTNRVGLTDVFRDKLNISSVGYAVNEDDCLSVITTGSLPPNPTELLASEKMEAILDDLKKMKTLVILDSAPALVSDAQVLAAKVDGVLLVVQPGKTHKDELRSTLEQFKRAGARLVGVVFNRIPQNRLTYYGGYKQYAPHLYRTYQYQSAHEPVAENPAEDQNEQIAHLSNNHSDNRS